MRLERWLYTIPLRLRSLFRRDRVEQELDEELRDHIERTVGAHVANGLTPEEARYAALRAMDGVEQRKEQCRDARRVRVIDDLLNDLRYAVRVLRRSPGFTAVSIVSLALGIGANTAIFTVVNTVLLRPLPYSDPSRLVVVEHGEMSTVAAANFLDWRDGNRVFERIGAAEFWTPNLSGTDKPEQLYALRLTADVLPLLGIPPALGRVFSEDEEHLGRDHVAVLSDALWKNRFASDPHAVGRTVSLDGAPYTIVGVMPPRFRFAPFWATRAQLWAPLALDARKADRLGASMHVFARLRSGVTIDRARLEMAAMGARIENAFPGTSPTVTVVPLQDRVVGDVRAALVILMAAVGLVLLIACANVAHLQLVRGASRARELAVRTALGASRGRVVRQLLTESLLLSAAGGAAGLLLAEQGTRVLIALGPSELPHLDTIVIDARVVAFMTAVTIVAGVAFGAAPAVNASRLDVNESLKEGSRSASDTMRRRRVRSALVVSEFAMALVLLVSAGLVLRSFFMRLAVDVGFDPRETVSMIVSVTGSKSADPARRATFFQTLVERVRGLPGVESASAINHVPLHGDNWHFGFAIEGRPPAPPGRGPSAAYRVVLPEYFQTMRIPIVKGRDFTAGDVREAPHVAIVNEYMARRYWPGADPIGQRITSNPEKPDWYTVVGVIKDVKQASWSREKSEEMYFPYRQSPIYLKTAASFASYMTLVVRGGSTPIATTRAIESIVHGLDADVPVSDVITLEDALAEDLAEPRFYTWLLSAFAGVALVLAAVGIYGVMSHAVARRTHEIGIRMALGAARRDVFTIVIVQGLSLAALGGAIGLGGAFAVTRFLHTLLFGIEPLDPVTFGIVAALLAAVGVLASSVPARRASRVDPMVALRCE